MVDSVLPWGMPCVMVPGLECALVVWVVCFRLVRYDRKKRVVSSVKLNSCFSLWMSLLCEMVSYALDRSM